MAVLLPILIAVPPVSGFIFESGVLDELKKITSPDDNGWPIPFTGGKRVGVGCRSRTTAWLERLLGVKKAPEQEPEEEDALVLDLHSSSGGVASELETFTCSPPGKLVGAVDSFSSEDVMEGAPRASARKDTPPSQRSASSARKETPPSQRSASSARKDAPPSQRSARKDAPPSQRSARKETPPSQRSARVPQALSTLESCTA